MTMHYIFCLAFDGPTHPDHAGHDCGVVGVATVGPRAFLESLCVRLGLGVASVPSVVRTAVWLRKLELASLSQRCFWTASMEVAPWACAETVLEMRDGLVEAGWPATDPHGVPARLRDVAQAEGIGPDLPVGRADLMREVVEALTAGICPAEISLVELIDAREDLPPIWSRLLGLLEAAGVEVRQSRNLAAIEADDDLAALRAHLAGAPPAKLTGDGSFAVFVARNELAAAEALAEWLEAALRDSAVARTVVVAEAGDTRVLDRAFARRGLPTLGLAPGGGDRGALALLPAAFAVRLSPPDPQAVVDMLSLPRPPVERWAAAVLLSALRRQPAFEGPAWAEAWEAIERRLRAERTESEALRLIENWRGWFEVGSWKRGGVIAVVTAVAFCERVASWAEAVDAGEGDPLILAVRVAAMDLGACVLSLGRDIVDLSLFEAMIRSAVAGGVSDPACRAEAGPLRAVGDAGAIWAPTDTVVWWGFAAGAWNDGPMWRAAEIAALASMGVRLDMPAAVHRRRETGWMRALGNAGRRLILVEPAQKRGSVVGRHPLSLNFRRLVAHEGNAARLRLDVGRELAGVSVPLAGRLLTRRAVSPSRRPPRRSRWTLPSAALSLPDGRIESASSLEDLVACQWRWTLRHVLGLRSRDAFALRSTQRMVGDLAHELARQTFEVGSRPDPAHVHEKAKVQFDAVLGATAAPLLRPEHAAELTYARRRIPEALAHLARLLADAGCTVDGFEISRGDVLDGIEVRSRIDMVVSAGDGRTVIVDLKWTGMDEIRRLEVEAGAAVQLATYARLVGGRAAAAYYMLGTRRFFAASAAPGLFEAVDGSKDTDAIWRDVVADWTMLRAGFSAGAVVARGAGDDAGSAFATTAPPEPCRFCGYRVLCQIVDAEVRS